MKSTDPDPGFDLQCPFPIENYPKVVMAHGGGGRLTLELIENLFLAAFGNPVARELLDGAVLNSSDRKLVISTDSHVISPLFFPGGDIGSLSVYGTTNDVAMCGARPEYLSVGFILEEGLAMDQLWKVALSMKKAADQVGVQIVTGDTKVVEHGKGDGIYINTTGIGWRPESVKPGPSSIQPGDAILVSGDIGRHGVAVMASREGLAFETDLQSDCGSLASMVKALLDTGLDIHCMRDLTRGGLATALLEISQAAQKPFEIEATAVPIEPAVNGACELLGLDPLYVANEGCFALFLPEPQVNEALEILQRFPRGKKAARIGQVETEESSGVTLKTELGTSRYLSLLSGEQLPRIC